jgi:flavin reductase/cob(II)yrinic acid a,c-diamide reductase
MPDSFRKAMRRVAATVSVLSTELSGRRFGITISSLASLTLEPPTLCFGIHRGSSFCEPMTRSGWLCVNVLSCKQERVGRVFSMPPATDLRFETGRWSAYELAGMSSSCGIVRLPCLEEAQANIICRLSRTIEHGTHLLCLADVKDIVLHDKVEPLLYCDGSYHELAVPRPMVNQHDRVANEGA